MSIGRLTSAFLWVLKNTLNRVIVRLARWGHGPFALIGDGGRKGGQSYQTPALRALRRHEFRLLHVATG